MSRPMLPGAQKSICSKGSPFLLCPSEGTLSLQSRPFLLRCWSDSIIQRIRSFLGHPRQNLCEVAEGSVASPRQHVVIRVSKRGPLDNAVLTPTPPRHAKQSMHSCYHCTSPSPQSSSPFPFQSRSSTKLPFSLPPTSNFAKNSAGTVGMYLLSLSLFKPPYPAP